MDDYKPNSHRSKQEEANISTEKKEIKKVATGKTKKKSGAAKLAETFISEDIHNVKSYIVGDVLIPAAKKAISDIVTNGIDMILYGETGRTKKRNSAGYISYNDYSSKDRDRRYADSSKSRYDYDDILFETRGEADAVIDQMGAVIDQYNVVTVADMYDMADLTAPYTSNKYGWTSIRDARVERVRDGYVIKMPKARPI